MHRKNGIWAISSLLLALAGVSQPCARADDWPGLLGPFRTGHSASQIALPNPLQSPKLVPKWKLKAGQGYAGLAVADRQAFLYDRRQALERVTCVDAFTGKSLWEKTIPANYNGGMDPDKGPRCVPTVTDRFVVLYSAAGDLTVLAKADGAILWTRNLRKDSKADDGYFGAGSTPLVIDDRVVVNVGSKSAGIVCVSLSDGKELWTATNYEASYASPIPWSSDDPSGSPTTVVIPTRYKTVGLNPLSGKTLWETPFGQRGPTVNAATPIPCNSGELFLTASYDIGNLTIRPNGSPEPTIIHRGFELSSQYATPVYIGGWIYGSDGREDRGGAVYKCLNPLTGKIAWEQTGMPICHSIAINASQLLLVGIDGSLCLIQPTPDAFAVLWKSSFGKGTYRALPALANNHLFVRSSSGNEGQDSWEAYELK